VQELGILPHGGAPPDEFLRRRRRRVGKGSEPRTARRQRQRARHDAGGTAERPAPRTDGGRCRGARVHNLKNVSLEIPARQPSSSSTGLSGLGASRALAFDHHLRRGAAGAYMESAVPATPKRFVAPGGPSPTSTFVFGPVPGDLDRAERPLPANPRSNRRHDDRHRQLLETSSTPRSGQAHCPRNGRADALPHRPTRILEAILAAAGRHGNRTGGRRCSRSTARELDYVFPPRCGRRGAGG